MRYRSCSLLYPNRHDGITFFLCLISLFTLFLFFVNGFFVNLVMQTLPPVENVDETKKKQPLINKEWPFFLLLFQRSLTNSPQKNAWKSNQFSRMFGFVLLYDFFFNGCYMNLKIFVFYFMEYQEQLILESE